MNEKQFETSLYECIEWSDYEDFVDCRINTFEDAGLLTKDRGIIIRLKTVMNFN